MRFYHQSIKRLAVLSLSLSLGCLPKLQRTIDPANRTPQGGREVKVSVTQGEIKADIQASTGGQAFGLIGALVDVGVNNSRATEAEKTVQVVRESLSGFDFDGLALARTKETLEKLDWFQAKDVAFGKEFTTAKRMEQLSGAKTPQVMYTDYYYSLSPDFSQVKVAMAATLARQGLKPGAVGTSLDPENLEYIQQFLVVYPLATPAKEAPENAKRWATDRGKLARTALEIGLTQIQRLFERSLAQTPEALIALDSAQLVSAGGYQGRLIAKMDEGTLMRLPNGHWVLVSAKEL